MNHRPTDTAIIKNTVTLALGQSSHTAYSSLAQRYQQTDHALRTWPDLRQDIESLVKNSDIGTSRNPDSLRSRQTHQQHNTYRQGRHADRGYTYHRQHTSDRQPVCSDTPHRQPQHLPFRQGHLTAKDPTWTHPNHTTISAQQHTTHHLPHSSAQPPPTLAPTARDHTEPPPATAPPASHAKPPSPHHNCAKPTTLPPTSATTRSYDSTAQAITADATTHHPPPRSYHRAPPAPTRTTTATPHTIADTTRHSRLLPDQDTRPTLTSTSKSTTSCTNNAWPHS